MQDRIDVVRDKLLREIETRLNARPGGSRTIMELARAFESLSTAGDREPGSP
jgi:hypothetical protein